VSDEAGHGTLAVRRRSIRRSLVLVSLILVVALAAGTTVLRARVTLADPNFDARDASGLLKSDPGLLYYLVGCVVESGGTPDDWRADPRIEHPGAYDVPAQLPVAQEHVIALLRSMFGDAMPLHVFCLWVSSAIASLVLIGVWLLALELCGDAWLALLAALLAALLPATMRTTGFLLMDEDWSLPFLALHLGLLARAVRVRTIASILLCALALGCAVATWHATSFLVTIEGACVLAVCLRAGVNPFRARFAWIVPVLLLAFALGVPFLRTTGFASSAPMVAVLALACAAIATRHGGAQRERATMVVALALFGATALVLAAAFGDGDYGHVLGLVAQKIAHFGVLPDDPRALSPEVRLMWQGPFATLDAGTAWTLLGISLLVVPFALHAAWKGLRQVGDPTLAATALLGCASVGAAWLVARVVVLPAMVLPPLAAALAVGMLGVPRARIALGILVLAQGIVFWTWLAGWTNPWYGQPWQRQPEIAAMVRAVERFVPHDAAVACDSINSTAILAHTRARVILSPKWESRASRERVVEFMHAFFERTPAQLHELLAGKYRCDWLLVDRFTLGFLSRYAAGYRPDEAWKPDSAAATFLSQDQGVLAGVPGFELVWRSPQDIRQSNGAPTDFFRLYRLKR
jgi:hypothetical protein